VGGAYDGHMITVISDVPCIRNGCVARLEYLATDGRYTLLDHTLGVRD